MTVTDVAEAPTVHPDEAVRMFVDWRTRLGQIDRVTDPAGWLMTASEVVDVLTVLCDEADVFGDGGSPEELSIINQCLSDRDRWGRARPAGSALPSSPPDPQSDLRMGLWLTEGVEMARRVGGLMAAHRAMVHHYI